MMHTRTKISLGILMLLGYFLMNTSQTSADLFDEEIAYSTFDMTTLELSHRHTANSTKPSTLFNIFQMEPNGYDIEALRIRKEGHVNFTYRLQSVFVTGSQALCDALEIEVWYDKDEVFTGPLNSLTIDRSIQTDEQDDWIMFISLPDNNPSLQNIQCDFQLRFRTWHDDPDVTSGFWDEALVTNTVTTGTW